MPLPNRRQRRHDIEDERISRIDMMIEDARPTTQDAHTRADRARASRVLTRHAKIKQQIAISRKR